MTTTKPILNFSIDPALLKRLDEFWHSNRFPNRAAAVKFLIAWALKQHPTPSAADLALAARPRGKRGAKS